MRRSCLLIVPTLIAATGAHGQGAPPSFAIRNGANTMAVGPTGAITESNAAPFGGAVSMSVGSTYAPQRSLAASCTSAGAASLTLADGSSLVVPLSVGFQILPFATVSINAAGTTSSCVYTNLK